MSLLSRDQIVTRALRRIGAYTPSMGSPGDGEAEEAAYWLDMIIGHEAARSRKWWMVEETKSFDLVADQARYDLMTAIGDLEARRGIQFIIGAYLYDVEAEVDLCELIQLRREEYEEIRNKADSGDPASIYINRMNSPIAFVHPVPTDARELQVRLVYQTFPEDMVRAGGSARNLGIRQSWQLWIVEALAHKIGSGPVRKLPADEIKEMLGESLRLRNEIEDEDDQQHASEPRRVQYYNGV